MSQPDAPPRHRLVDVHDGEAAALILSCAYFFLVLASYYVLRPLRDAMGLAGGVKQLPWLFLATLGGMLLANPLFSALVSRLPRRRFIPIVYRFFGANLLLFFVLLRVLPAGGGAALAVARAFFVWTSVFNLFAVSVSWAFMADLYRPEQGVRLFGFIGMGGTLGAMAGAALTASLAESLGPVNLLLVAAALLEGAVHCAQRLGRDISSHRSAAPQQPADQPLSRGGAVGALGWVFRNPYLAAICLFMLLYTFTSTLAYFEQAGIVAAAVKSDAQRTALFARMDLYVNLLSLAGQALLAAPLLRLVGVAGALAVLPVISLAGFTAVALRPSLAVLVAFQVVRRAAEYAVTRPAREVLFTVLSREAKYKAKSFIDTFVYRTGDAVGAWAFGLIGPGVAFATVGWIALPVCAAWLAAALFLGRRERQLAQAPAST